MEQWSDRGAALIPYGDKVILMRRERGYGKHKKIYYTIPGGGKEESETIRDTTVREIKEELGIEIEIAELFMEFSTSKRKQYVFIGRYKDGVIGTGDGEEFEDNDYKINGGYYPELVSYEQFKKIRLVPLNLKRAIIRNFRKIIDTQTKEEYISNKENADKNVTNKVLKQRPKRNKRKFNKGKNFHTRNNKNRNIPNKNTYRERREK